MGGFFYVGYIESFQTDNLQQNVWILFVLIRGEGSKELST